MSFWGATVITNLFSAIPVVGESIVTWLWGGFSVDNSTLNRFFSLHFVLPFVIVGVVILHLVALHRFGSNNPIGIDVKGTQDTLPFNPYYTIKDLFGLGFLRYYAGVYMGEGHSSYANGDLGMMYLARFEVLPFGMFKDYSEAAFSRSSQVKLKLGAGAAYLEKGKKNKGIVGSDPFDGGTTDTKNLNADLTFRYSGLSLESAYFWREGTRHPGVDAALIPTEQPRNGMGYYGQAGYLLPHSPFEISARFGQIMSAGDGSSLSDQSEAGVGLNYYFAQHAMKIQGDYFRFWSGDAFATGSDQVRIQMQMAY
jgi:hypothetical protein